ncbi:MAG: glycosyltransferase family 9 protein [Nitrososphaeria archaeon]
MIITKIKEFTKKLAKYILWWPASPKVTYFWGELFFKIMGMRCKRYDLTLTEIQKVLIIRLDEIGDIVMTTPFLREIRRNLPSAWIALVVNPQVYNLVELCPYVNEVLVYNWRVSKFLKPLQRHWRALCLARKHLWKQHFDLVIVPRWDIDNYHATFIAYFSGASWRVGYSENVNEIKNQFNKGFDKFFTHVLKDQTVKHEVEHNLDIIRFLGGEIKEDHLELWLSKEDEAFAEWIIMNHNIGWKDLLVGIGPGASTSNREWPLQSFIELGKWLIKEYNAKIIVVGGSKEENLGRMLKQELGNNVINTAGMTTLRQTAALLKHCQLFIGNDSGPMHLAAAMGVPIVELSCHPLTGSPYAVNSPYRFGPWGVKNIILQPHLPTPPCHEQCIIINKPHCILGISVEQVKQAVVNILTKIDNT